ncbi:SEFIR domain-containing protein [Clostridium sp. UBA871]|uniref:SEFIR domain-containing protein n=1 Tax=Clostridium sp. UBA871 TaxID=1946380 RepID=UPI003217A4D6
MGKVFVTYSWSENNEENEKVYSFVDMLRSQGYDAECDKNRLQKETASSFTKIMSEGLSNDKIIVVLSAHYKKKAEKFAGGVGIEYKIIGTDINTNTNKYILVSFDGISNDTIGRIVPQLYKSHEIVDLIKDEEAEFQLLFSKLNGEEIIEFSDVAKTIPSIQKRKPEKFTLKDKKKSV